MTNDYYQVREALKTGADPAMLCSTCPWTRNCVEPPPMTPQDVEEGVKKSMAQAEERGGEKSAFAGVLIGALAYGGRDSRGEMCPVFILKLRSPEGRGLVDSIKTVMQGQEVRSE